MPAKRKAAAAPASAKTLEVQLTLLPKLLSGEVSVCEAESRLEVER